ncbi:Protein kinase domain,Protein kinase-like domain,Serine/threonine-protein kinase, active [Cinara cedri]|uniref:Protein kinase domain,Protein kinase-like domain,Serine/threonine-protein kinase, active n=1 Tax=Cinara cedri TaxID=506608 RepID=A0A5E4MMV5_9HEMI|nr:Protein kinase domain,Protein kinase-like domain,Serine/threonine-protein kinase, active [Cinara cedri]
METAAGRRDGTAVRRKASVYLKQIIGAGAFGRVWYCVTVGLRRRETVDLALKIVNKQPRPGLSNASVIDREIAVLKTVRHPNVVLLIRSVSSSSHVYMFLEYCKNGDMERMVRMAGPYVEWDARILFSQIVSAVEYLHGMDVAHRDLKPENVLLDHHNRVKIADFGFAKFCRDPCTKNRKLSYRICGTPTYMPPEALSSKDGYNAMLFDIWSMGGILHYMLTGQVPFDGGNPKRILKQQMIGDICVFRSVYWRMASDPAKLLVRWMLEPDVLKRARLCVIKQSKWMVGWQSQ